jgi:hypothetical protein
VLCFVVAIRGYECFRREQLISCCVIQVCGACRIFYVRIISRVTDWLLENASIDTTPSSCVQRHIRASMSANAKMICWSKRPESRARCQKLLDRLLWARSFGK